MGRKKGGSLLDMLFGTGGKRFTTKGKSKARGGSYSGVRQKGHESRAGYETYQKSTGKGKGQFSVRESSGPDKKTLTYKFPGLRRMQNCTLLYINKICAKQMNN